MGTGFVQAMAPCCICGKPFAFNPHAVPSVKINGIREPICVACITLANEQRVAMGLPAHVIQPDAYDALPEDEL